MAARAAVAYRVHVGDTRRRRPRPRGECTIPPPIPDTALPELVFKRDLDAERAVRQYIEREGREQVTHAECVLTEHVLGQKYEAWDVRTTVGRWWVVTPLTNLYSQELFPSVDYTLSFHIGVTARVMARSRSKPRVEHAEQALMPAAWRKWQQAAETLDEAEEAEDFQGVGMRCRESLIATVKAVAKADMVPPGTEAPKRADVSGWCELIADRVARGSSAECVRKYLKATAKAGWQLANWLTHASGATMADAMLTLDATHHVLGTFGTAVFRHANGIPDQCPVCASYRIGLRRHPEHEDGDPVPGCQSCGWVDAPRG